MMIIFFFYGLAFFGLGLVALMRIRQGEEIPLRKHLPWLAAFGFAVALTNWMDMFLAVDVFDDSHLAIRVFTMASHPIIGLLLLKFGWGIFKDLLPLPPWTIFIPGVLIVPISFVITYAATTFITPSPIEIPIDIWSRYLLYLPGSILAGIGFLRQWHYQRTLGYNNASRLMLAAAFAFVFEALVVGLVVPAAPYGPVSYYNYDRVVFNAFAGEQIGVLDSFGLDYSQVLNVTGLPIEFWRMLSAFAVSFFVVRGLEVFDESQKIKLKELQGERDLAQKITLQTQIDAKETAERWTEALVNINRQISNLDHVDEILINIGKSARKLLNSDFLGIALLNDDNNELILNYYSTANNSEVVRDFIPVQNSIIRNVVQEKQHYFSQVLEPTEKMAHSCFLDEVASGTIACVYLNFDSRPIGAIWVARTTGVPYQEEDLIWLECMADQVVIAIQHGIMTAQMQSISVSEERARIAREMHDGLAQVLGYLNLQVQTIEALHKAGKNELLIKELKHMRQAIKTAHGDVRENILSLRTTLANKKGLLQAIEEYLQEFGIQTGITTNLKIQSDCDLTLSSIAEVQLVCILQEALANVRKHSHAKSVDVKISLQNNQDENYIQMQVFDNGLGFTIQDSKRRFGLKTMQERAKSVSGILEIDSKLGEGTKVTCRIPCLDQETLTTKDTFLTGNISDSVTWSDKA